VLLPGDQILRVDGVSTRGWSEEKAVQELRGPRGSKVTLAIGREGMNEPLAVEIVRRPITLSSVPYAFMLRDGIGYVRFTQFSENGRDELHEAIRDLEKNGMRSLVLDIRGNPGGLLDESIEVTDLFLPKGAEIVSTKGRMPETDRVYEARDNDDFSVHPMIVLVDRASASASEILAGALQDHDRALIVGAPTWGKGLVQSLFPLDDGYFLKLTTARYYTPSGRSIQRDEDLDLDFSEVIWPGEVGVPDQEEEIPIPDSLVFRTDMGRTVYGGGGVMPDVMVRGEDIADVSLDLFRDMIATNAFFSFAVHFRASHPSIPRDYMPDDRLIDQFKEFLQAKGVTFTDEAFEAERAYLRDFLRYTLISHVHGEGAARQAVMEADLPLTKAVGLLSEAETLADLFRLAERERSAARSAAVRPAPSGR
jgi:carboxyl-terminal processing protease